MMDARKHELYTKMTEAVYEYKFKNGTKESAMSATQTFAEYCGITYEHACDIAIEIFI